MPGDVVTPRERVAALDGDPRPGRPPDVDPDIHQVLSVLATITPVSRQRIDELPLVEAEEADASVAASAIVARLRARAPELVDGPIDLAAQRWIAAGSLSHHPRRPQLASSSFVAVDHWSPSSPATTPHGVGLYTSTASVDRHGMWRSYLASSGGTLFPRPWHVWRLEPEPDVAVLEIATAAAWVELVRAYPRRDDDRLAPDWGAVAREWDAVHLTLGAVIATQGIRFPAGEATVLPPYWDVESTLWLRWRFRSVELVAVER
jgi:hypothetical protein